MRKQNVILAVMMIALAAGSGVAQILTLSAAANDGRPVNTIAGQIEKLSGIPISYEDLRYENLADTMDVTNSVVRGPVSPGVRVIVPRGGALSVTVTVDPTSQKLPDSLGTSNALNALLAAASNSPAIAGRFRIDSYNGAFFVVPTQARAANGALTPLTPALSTPIDLPGQEQTAIETLEAILQQVSQKAGLKVQIGTIPIKAFAVTKTRLAATNQPAEYVLARLLSAVCAAGVSAVAYAPGMSYHAYFDPQAKYYVINIHVVPNPKTPPAALPPSVPVSGASPYSGKNP